MINKGIHRTLLSLIITAVIWIVVDNFIINIPIWKYFLLEYIFIFSMKILIFMVNFFQLNNTEYGEKDTYK